MTTETSATITAIAVTIERTGFFDSWHDDADVDHDATITGYAAYVANKLREAYPGAAVTVNTLGDNQFAYHSVVIDYDDDNQQTYPDHSGSYNVDVLYVRDIIERAWTDAEHWVVNTTQP